jgi:hypothetical protein
MEIVSEPDMRSARGAVPTLAPALTRRGRRSPEEAGAYIRALQQVLRAVGASDGNMENVRASPRAGAGADARAHTGFAAVRRERLRAPHGRAARRAVRDQEPQQRQVRAGRHRCAPHVSAATGPR